jgi:hypothetical protein
MARRVASLPALWQWLERSGARWLALRHDDPERPPRDVDLLIEDTLAPELDAFLASGPRRAGVKIDRYGVEGRNGTGYHGHPHLPVDLGRRSLERRVRRGDGVFVAEPRDHALALAYHAVYHKADQCGLDWREPAAARDARAGPALARAFDAAGLDVALTLRDLHNRLVAEGAGVSRERLEAYTRHDFRHGRKVYFHARLMSQAPGEMNLFVIREVAARHEQVDVLLDRLGERYELVRVKSVPWLRRVAMRKRMRGGKWRRGGFPCVAVVVFDPDPVPSSPSERANHPHVFNRNQFAKVAWRESFTETTRARAKDNPVHSTDNEAEALGHLGLFFDEAEQAAIARRVIELRGGQVPEIGPDAGD